MNFSGSPKSQMYHIWCSWNFSSYFRHHLKLHTFLHFALKNCSKRMNNLYKIKETKCCMCAVFSVILKLIFCNTCTSIVLFVIHKINMAFKYHMKVSKCIFLVLIQKIWICQQFQAFTELAKYTHFKKILAFQTRLANN